MTYARPISDEAFDALWSAVDNELSVWMLHQSIPASGPIQKCPYNVPEWADVDEVIIGEYVAGQANPGDVVVFHRNGNGSGWHVQVIIRAVELIQDLEWKLKQCADRTGDLTITRIDFD